MKVTAEIHRFAPIDTDGRRRRTFTVRGVEVTTLATGDATDDEAISITVALADSATAIRRAIQRAEEAEAREEIWRETAEAHAARIPPPAPERLLGPGCVRFRDGKDGPELWLLNKREGGWGSWGMRLDGWDDLFRRYAVRVTGHGRDDAGDYWMVTP